jgi:hypothetical protein
MPKPAARAILFAISSPTCEVVSECFRQFGVATILDDDPTGARLKREKFEACVVALDDPEALSLIEAARKSRSNHRILIYGLASSTTQALKYSRFGVNAIIDVPINRTAAMKVVRASHLLVLNELRRYARVPIVNPAKIKTEERNFDATTVEISAGGMSIKTDRSLLMNSSLSVEFKLPPATDVKIRAQVAWISAAEQRIGVRFDASDGHRLRVKDWVEHYLQIS